MFSVYEQKVDSFFRTHLLHWIEALALMGKVDEAVQIIIDLQSLGRESKASALGRLTRDVERVLLRCRSGIEAAPLQIYSSALAFAPRKSEVRKLFAEHYLPPWICRLPEVEDNWDYSLQTLPSKSRGRRDIAFSSDDSRLLFSFLDPPPGWSPSVEIWDAGTGTLHDTLPHRRESIMMSMTGYSLQNGVFFYEIQVDQTVIVRDLQRGIHYTVVGAGSSLRCLCVSPNRQLLATVHGNRYKYKPDTIDNALYAIKFWDLSTGLPCGAKSELIGYPRIDFSPDGRFVALISEWGVKLCGQMESWEIRPIIHNRYNEDEAETCASSPNGRFSARIFTNRVELCDPQTGLHDDRFPHDARTYAFSPDGRFVALISTRVKVQDQQTCLVDNYEARISPDDGQWLVDLPDLVGDSKNVIEVIQLWDTTTGDQLSDRLEIPTADRIESMVFSPDGHLLAAADSSQIFLWDLNTHSLSCTLTSHDSIQCITFSPPEARLLACGNYDSTVLVWNLDRPASCKTLSGNHSPIFSLAFSSDGRLLASACRYSNRAVRLWDASGIASTASDGNNDSDGGNNRHACRRAVLSPDGHVLGVASENGTVRLWTMHELVASLPPLADYGPDSYYDPNLVFSADSSLLAIHAKGEVVRVWDVGANEIAATLHTHHDQHSTMALRFLPDNRTLAGCDGKCLYLWRWRTEPMPQIVQHGVFEDGLTGSSYNNTLTSSPDGQLIGAMLWENNTIIVADCTGNLHHTIPIGGMECITISPDKECLAAADYDGIRLFDLKTGKLRWSLKSYSIDAMAFSPDGQLLASIDDRAITLWDLHTRRRQVLGTALSVGTEEIRKLDFSTDGLRLIANRGMWLLPGAFDSPSQPLSIPADLTVAKDWVTWKMARVLWIPHHLLTSNIFAAGNVVAFVSEFGLPTWVGFDPSKRPTDEASENQFTWEGATDFEFEEIP